MLCEVPWPGDPGPERRPSIHEGRATLKAPRDAHSPLICPTFSSGETAAPRPLEEAFLGTFCRGKVGDPSRSWGSISSQIPWALRSSLGGVTGEAINHPWSVARPVWMHPPRVWTRLARVAAGERGGGWSRQRSAWVSECCLALAHAFPLPPPPPRKGFLRWLQGACAPCHQNACLANRFCLLGGLNGRPRDQAEKRRRPGRGARRG